MERLGQDEARGQGEEGEKIDLTPSNATGKEIRNHANCNRNVSAGHLERLSVCVKARLLTFD